MSQEDFQRALAGDFTFLERDTQSPSAPPQTPAPPFVALQKSGETWTAIGPDNSVLFSDWAPGSFLNESFGTIRVKPEVDTALVDGGLRLSYRYRNQSSQTRELASIRLPTLKLAGPVTLQDVREIGQDYPMGATIQRWYGTYPRALYCPTIVLRNAVVSVGVSVLYPVFEYQHDIRLSVAKTANGDFDLTFGLENAGSHDGDSFIFNLPVLRPNEELSYTVEIRFAPADKWMETLAPYRNYFRGHYGAPSYERDGRPIAGASFAMEELQTSSNPKGWVSEIGGTSVEANGMSSARTWLQSRYQSSNRVLVWTPSGLNPRGSISYPYQFATEIPPRRDQGGNPSLDLPPPLSGVNAQGQLLGFWWGKSASVERFWNDPLQESLDPSRPDHLALAFRELDAAVASGVSFVGLDAFAHSFAPVWRLAPFLAIARQRHPHLMFCSEGRGPDVLHVLAATWCDAYRVSVNPEVSERIPSVPFQLADYLNPGQETWVGMCFDRSTNSDLRGPSALPLRKAEEIGDIWRLGYVPVTWDLFDLRGMIR